MTICDALKLIVMIVIGGVRSNRAHARPSGATLQPRAIMDAIEKAAQALAQLSDRRIGGVPTSTSFGIWPKNFAIES